MCRLRERAVREILNQHCALEETDESAEKERFLTDKLLIPMQWIHEAKATRARRDGDQHREALHLFRAGHWNRCHRLIIQNLASGSSAIRRAVIIAWTLRIFSVRTIQYP